MHHLDGMQADGDVLPIMYGEHLGRRGIDNEPRRKLSTHNLKRHLKPRQGGRGGGIDR